MLIQLAKCGKKRVDPHACRNLHNLITRTGRVLPVPISYLRMCKRISRRKLAAIPMAHPILKLTSWAETIFNHGGHFFMRGRSFDTVLKFQEELLDFWTKYAKAEGDHPFFCKVTDRNSWPQYIPIAIHGDEGRGRQKQPVLVISYQPLLPLLNQKTNMKRFLDNSVS